MLTTRFTRVLLPVLLMTACSAPTGTASDLPRSAPVATATSSATPTAPELTSSPPPPKDVCAAALPGKTLLGWGAATVGNLRAYRYGPQGNPPPLANTFPGAADDDPATWCATRAGGRGTAWWGVVGDTVGHLITIDGPGEGRKLGEVSGPPQVP